jgi:hypothetical protein
LVLRGLRRKSLSQERDVLSLSGVSAVIWLEGINDFSKNGNASAGAIQARMKELLGRSLDGKLY